MYKNMTNDDDKKTDNCKTRPIAREDALRQIKLKLSDFKFQTWS